MEYLENLNSEQKKAVLATEGPVLILAGAGSGKTRVITHRICYLIDYKTIQPESICAVTFTNKAAEEMKERIEKMLSPTIANRVMIRTFHSLCLFILRKESMYANLRDDFTVYDTELQDSLVKECMKELGYDIKQLKPSTVSSFISQAKDNLVYPDNYCDYFGRDQFTIKIENIYSLYEKKKKSRNALDFGDLIFLTAILFKSNPKVLKKYANKWKYLMVDEYQDTNRAQYELVRILGSQHNNLCVVGDDDQSIYSWRGADINNILSFHKDFSNTLIIKLEENYRSTPEILKAASSIISNNIKRTNKTIYTNNPSGEKISFNSFDNEWEEAESVVQNILNYKEKYKNQFIDFAIFYRTNAQSRYFEEALRKNKIPYKIFGGFRFFDRKEIKDIIAYLNVIANPLDSTSLLRIINTPSRGIGDATIEKIQNYSIEHGLSLLESLDKEIHGIKKATISKLKELKNLILHYHYLAEKKHSPSEICKNVIEESGLRRELESESSEESTSRLENLNEFLNSIEDYERSTKDPSLSEFLNNISLVTSEQENPELKDYVVLMTVHNSKGLEFNYVFITGLEEGTFPHALSMDEEESLEEERRLMYVAITRARKKCFLSYCRYTRKFGTVEVRIPSRFLNEIPKECLEGMEERELHGVRKPDKSPIAANISADNNLKSTKSLFYEGCKVRHRVYGIGKIIQLTGSGENQKAVVQFGSLEKKFLVAYTPLDIIE